MNKTTLTWVDTGSRERLTVLASFAGCPATIAALRLLSNATVTTLHDGDVQSTGAPLAPSATYPDLEDTWVVTAEDASGNVTQLYIPAPLLTVATADLENYAPLAPEWNDVATALPALVAPYSGISLNQLDHATIARATPDAFVTYRGWDETHDLARRTLQWVDIHGNQRLTHLIGDLISLGSDFDTAMIAFVGVSNAVVTHYWEGALSVIADVPTTDMYNSVNDECRVTFVDVNGNETVVIIPAPNRAIFLADGKTLDQEQANVADFISAAEADLLVPISLGAVTACVNGLLGKRMVL